MGFGEFIQSVINNPVVLVTVVLTLGVIFVNGWTDAPNAIATCVATRAIAPGPAIIMAAIMNFFGVLLMSILNGAVANTIYKMVDFSSAPAGEASAALCAALVAIIVWAVAAWAFGIPTSESHALIAGITGAAIALHGSLDGVNGDQWIKVVVGIAVSTFAGFGFGILAVKLNEFIFKNADRRKTNPAFKKAQIAGGAAMAFMHGAQDGQKFIGVFLLGVFLVNGSGAESFGSINMIDYPWLMILCSIVMAVGTSIGGYKILKSVGFGMVKLETYQGFSADIAGAGCLLLASLTGLPVSTTHAKTTAIMGVGAAKRIKAVNWGVVKEMVLTWVLTFPGCGLLGFLAAKLFMMIF